MNKTILSVLLITGMAGNACASHAEDNEYYDDAQVVSAEPVYADVARDVPQRECRVERVRHASQPARTHRSATGTIVGTMVGAAIGNQIGRDKHGRKIGRVAGAILGASIGHDISRHHGEYPGNHVEYSEEERCETQYNVVHEEALVGYNVAYRYHGRLYHTRTQQHPGRRIKVAVEVRPVE